MKTAAADNLARRWDFAVVGAGPAGTLAAFVLASRGQRVLLLDHAKFPRDKVCGGCLNGAALAALARAGLGGLPRKLGAPPVRALRLSIGPATGDFALPAGCAVLRSTFDAALVAEAVARGAVFADGMSVKLLPAAGPSSGAGMRRLALRSAHGHREVEASVVLACDGLRGTLLDNEPGCGWRISRGSRIGVSGLATPPETADGDWPAGVIHMAVARRGYVGGVRLADGRLDVAAALDPAACRRAGGPERMIGTILRSAGRPAVEVGALTGTGRLTRRRNRLGGHRVLAIGDACGYVEPFTGEGMAWALTGALAGAEMALRGLADWPEDWVDQWTAVNGCLLARRRTACWLVSRVLRRPAAAAAAMRAGRMIPALSRSLITALNRPVELSRGFSPAIIPGIMPQLHQPEAP